MDGPTWPRPCSATWLGPQLANVFRTQAGVPAQELEGQHRPFTLYQTLFYAINTFRFSMQRFNLIYDYCLSVKTKTIFDFTITKSSTSLQRLTAEWDPLLKLLFQPSIYFIKKTVSSLKQTKQKIVDHVKTFDFEI